MPKTAMNELIEILEGNKKAFPPDEIYAPIRTTFTNAIINAKSLLDQEKKQLEEAFKYCYKNGIVHPGNNMNKDWEKYSKLFNE